MLFIKKHGSTYFDTGDEYKRCACRVPRATQGFRGRHVIKSFVFEIRRERELSGRDVAVASAAKRSAGVSQFIS